MRRFFLAALILLAPLQEARSITLADLPAQLQACMGAGTCTVDTAAPAAVMGSMEAYRFTDNLAGLPTTGYALRYTLQPPSGRYNNDIALASSSGDVWLTVQDSYALAGDSNLLTVYVDTINPVPGSLLLGDSNGLDITIAMTNDAILSGAGFRSVTFEDVLIGSLGLGNMDLIGDIVLYSDSALAPCAAEGCYATAILNLVYLNYVDQGNGTAILSFNPGDARALLYEVTLGISDPTNSGIQESSYRDSYYVAPVPLPATAWLLLSGVVLLPLRMRRIRG